MSITTLYRACKEYLVVDAARDLFDNSVTYIGIGALSEVAYLELKQIYPDTSFFACAGGVCAISAAIYLLEPSNINDLAGKFHRLRQHLSRPRETNTPSP